MNSLFLSRHHNRNVCVQATFSSYRLCLPHVIGAFVFHCPLSAPAHTCPPAAPAWKVQDVLPMCMCVAECAAASLCVSAWPSAPPHAIRTSLSDAAHLLSRQAVSTLGVQVPFSFCLPVATSLSLPFRLYTQTNSHELTHSCGRAEHLLLRHLPKCRVTDISHPAVTDDGQEQGQLFPALSSRVLEGLWLDIGLISESKPEILSAYSLGTVSSIFCFSSDPGGECECVFSEPFTGGYFPVTLLLRHFSN